MNDRKINQNSAEYSKWEPLLKQHPKNKQIIKPLHKTQSIFEATNERGTSHNYRISTSPNPFRRVKNSHQLRHSLSLDGSTNVVTNKLRPTNFFPTNHQQNRRFDNQLSKPCDKDQIKPNKHEYNQVNSPSKVFVANKKALLFDKSRNKNMSLQENRAEIKEGTPTAIYGVAQGYGTNFVMEIQRIKKDFQKLYVKLQAEPINSPKSNDLKVYLGIPQHSGYLELLDSVYKALEPEEKVSQKIKEKKLSDSFIVDFYQVTSSQELHKQIVNMFQKPRCFSSRYEKIDGKLEKLIFEFSVLAELLQSNTKRSVSSPAHIQHMIKDLVSPAKSRLIDTFLENQLWVRWATPSYLPPLSHLYMFKSPPAYEVRKAVTLALIAEHLRKMPDIIIKNVTPEQLCPPIYGRLQDDCRNNSWQVSEYNEETQDFQVKECNLPSWLDQNTELNELLYSSNRSVFKKGEHYHALYAVYLLVIKDFTLCEIDDLLLNDYTKQLSKPSKLQCYIGCSSTGTFFEFCANENNHGKKVLKALKSCPKLEQFRCFQDCNLVEACLALSWLRKQPRAVLVLNSFMTSKNVTFSLEKKKPIHNKMINLTNHLISKSKKLPPLNNMLYGMHASTNASNA